MVNTDYILPVSQEDLERRARRMSSCEMNMQGKKLLLESSSLSSTPVQSSSYWKFLAEKLPLEKESHHSPISEIEEEGEDDEGHSTTSEEFSAVQSIDAVLHIVADNHKSHEAAQRRHSCPASGNNLKPSVSAPALSHSSHHQKSKNRWGQSTNASEAGSMKHSLKVPSRSPPSSSQGNATWSDQPADMSSSSAAAVSSLESLGLSDPRTNAMRLRKNAPKYHRSQSMGSGDLVSSSSKSSAPSGEMEAACRWSIPSTSSDSLFVPRRCQES